MSTVALVYSFVATAVVAVAAIFRARPEVVVEAALCVALGSSVRIAVANGGESAFWYLVWFGPLLVSPLICLVQDLRRKYRARDEGD